jgi:hypothetical protein
MNQAASARVESVEQKYRQWRTQLYIFGDLPTEPTFKPLLGALKAALHLPGY